MQASSCAQLASFKCKVHHLQAAPFVASSREAQKAPAAPAVPVPETSSCFVRWPCRVTVLLARLCQLLEPWLRGISACLVALIDILLAGYSAGACNITWLLQVAAGTGTTRLCTFSVRSCDSQLLGCFPTFATEPLLESVAVFFEHPSCCACTPTGEAYPVSCSEENTEFSTKTATGSHP